MLETPTSSLAAFMASKTLLSKPPILVGLDAFIDLGFHVVAKREGPGEAYQCMDSILAWAKILEDAAGKSMNAELIPIYERMGGNGPLLAHGLGQLGAKVTTVGAFGIPGLPVFPEFQGLQRYGATYSLGAPGRTHALEFPDGKLLLGITNPMEAITFERLITQVPHLAALLESHAALALVNWTMLPHMTRIFEGLLDLLEGSPYNPQKSAVRFFFDLADPQKRPQAQLQEALKTITRFETHGPVALGLNLREAEQVAAVLGLGSVQDTPESLMASAQALRSRLGLSYVLIHPVKQAACASAQGAWCLSGDYCHDPVSSTGAGDHLNAGFLAALVAGLEPKEALGVALSVSGSYVRGVF